MAGDSDPEIKKILFKENIVELICDVSTTFPLSDEFKTNISWFMINLTNDQMLFKFKDVKIILFF